MDITRCQAVAEGRRGYVQALKKEIERLSAYSVTSGNGLSTYRLTNSSAKVDNAATMGVRPDLALERKLVASSLP